MPQVANGWQIHHRFYRSLIAELLIGPIGRRALCRHESWEGKREAGAINLEVAMKTHFIAIGAMLLFAALAFGMDVGVTALLLMHS